MTLPNFLVLVKYSGLNREASSVSGSENIFSEILVHSDNDNIFTTPSLIFEEYFNVYIIKHQYLLKKLQKVNLSLKLWLMNRIQHFVNFPCIAQLNHLS